MSEVSKVKIAFAGVGDMGQMGHLKNCATLPECEVVALCELRADLPPDMVAAHLLDN